jgi:Tol biopolymer transport system component
MNFNTSLTAAWLVIVLAACTSSKNNTGIPYPEPAPDSVATIFLPGIVSGDTLDFNAAFSVEGKTFYFSRSRNRKYVIFETEYRDDKWRPETISPLFDTLYSNTDPFVAPDSAIYFISNRPKDKSDTTDDYDIYRIVKQGNTYGQPEYLAGVNSDSTEYYVSVSRAGNIYFSSYRDGNLDLFMSKKNGATYEEPVNLGVLINSVFDEHDPLIAPDESFLVYTSTRSDGFGEADLYITHKTNGQWDAPRNMGPGINTKAYEYCPALSPDGKYFFFSSEFQVKWISSEVLRK